MTKILWHSQSPLASTGYGQQTDIITGILNEMGFEVGILAWEYTGNKLIIPPKRRHLFAGAGGFGEPTTYQIIKEWKPDGVICLGDWWMNNYVHHLPREHDYWSAHWLPVDGIPIGKHTKWSDSFNAAQLIVNMSQFGIIQFNKGMEYARSIDRPVMIENTIIPHGIDLERFHRASEEDILDAKKTCELNENALIIGVVARNQPRKNYPRLIETFKKWVESRKLSPNDVQLYIHALAVDMAGWNLKFIIGAMDMEDYIKFNPFLLTPSFGIEPDKLNAFYSMIDVKLLPTAGEGFGLPTAEAMACEVPVGITNFTNSAEFFSYKGRSILEPQSYTKYIDGRTGEFRPDMNWKHDIYEYEGTRKEVITMDNGWLLDYDDIFIQKGNVMRCSISRLAMLNWFDKVYELWSNNQQKLRSMGKKGRKIIERFFDVKLVAKAWGTHIEKMTEQYENKSIKRVQPAHVYTEAYMECRKWDSNECYCKTEQDFGLEKIKELVSKDIEIQTILEVGCGSGEGMKRLNREGFITVGVDIAKEAIKYCRKNGQTAFYASADTLGQDLENAGVNMSFDAILSQHTLEHVEDWKAVIREFCTVAKKLCVITVPHDNMRDPTHVKKYLVEDMDIIEDFIIKEFGGHWIMSYKKVGDKWTTVSYVILLEFVSND